MRTKHHPNFGLGKPITNSIQTCDAKPVKRTYPSLQITAKAPEKGCLEDEISFQNFPFSGSGHYIHSIFGGINQYTFMVIFIDFPLQ